MAYIGRPLNAGNLAVQSGTGDGADTTPIATLDYSVGSSNSIGVYLDGVRQLSGTDFTASGTVLTFTTAPANGVGVDVYFLGLELSIPTPADATVSTAKIVDDAVTLAKMAPGTDGNIISYDASGNPVAIATGSDGQVLTSTGAGSPPAFEAVAGITTAAEARLGGTVAVANTTWVKLTFSDDSTVSGEHKSYDEDGDYDAGNSKFIAPANGKYFVHASLNFFSSNVDGKVYRAGVYVNGTLVHWSEVGCAQNANYQFPQVTALLKLDASDYVEIYGWQNSGAASNVQADNAVSNFKIHRLS